MYAVTAGYPYFVQAYGKAVWDNAVGPEISADDVAIAAPEAEGAVSYTHLDVYKRQCMPCWKPLTGAGSGRCGWWPSKSLSLIHI